jgi:hypothetical protein
VDFTPIEESKLNWQPPKELDGKLKYELEYSASLCFLSSFRSVDLWQKDITLAPQAPKTNGVNGHA